MEEIFSITQEKAVALALDRIRESFGYVEISPLALIENYQSLLHDLSFIIESIQNGGVGKPERDETEDPGEILEQLRKAFSWKSLSRNITNMTDMIALAHTLEDCRFISQNITPNKEK